VPGAAPWRRLRAAPQPCCVRLDWRGAERAPLAEPGTLSAMEASVVRLSTERRFADEGVRLRKNRFEFELKSVSRGGLPPFRAQAGGRARNLGEAGSAQPEGRALDGGGTPTAPSLYDEARRWHPSLLAALRASAGRRPPPKPCSLRCATRIVTPDGVRQGEVVVERRETIARFTPPGGV